MIALVNPYRTLVTRLQTQIVAAAPVSTPVSRPVAAVPVASTPAMLTAAPAPEMHACGGRCGSLPSSSTPATAGGPGATPAALPAPSLSLATVGSTQLPPPAGSTPPAKDSADPKAVGSWLQRNGGLWLWVIVAIVLIVVLAPASGRRSSW